MFLFLGEVSHLGISLRLRPREIPRKTHAIPRSDEKSTTSLAAQQCHKPAGSMERNETHLESRCQAIRLPIREQALDLIAAQKFTYYKRVCWIQGRHILLGEMFFKWYWRIRNNC